MSRRSTGSRIRLVARLGCACVGLLGCPLDARAQAAAPPPIKVGRLTIGGFVQADYRATFDEASTTGTDGFLLRRARVSFTGELAPAITFIVQGDFTASPIARDLHVTFSGLPAATIRVGQFVSPFGLERMTSSNRLELIDRSVVAESLTPSRDLGVMVFNTKAFWGWLSYHAAIVNGAGQNNRDTNDAKDVVGRASVALPQVNGLTVAVNGNAGTPPEGDRRRLGVDVTYEQPRYRLSAERIFQSVTGTVDRDVSGLVLIGVWKRPAQTRTDYFAGYELTARFVDIDDDAETLTARELQFGGNYYITPQVRVMSNLIVVIGDDQPQTRTRWWSRPQIWF